MTDLRQAAQQAIETMLNRPDGITDAMFKSIAALQAVLAAPQPEPAALPFSATYPSGAPMYSKTRFKDNGDPIMLNEDGTRSIFCDVDEGSESQPKPEPFDLNEARSKELFRTAFEPQPEPVGIAGELFTFTALQRLDLRPSTKVYITAPPQRQPQPEPVFEVGFGWLDDAIKYPKGTKFYTTPPQRQPLTDEQIIRIYETAELAGTEFASVTEKVIAIFRAAEKAHGIGGDK